MAQKLQPLAQAVRDLVHDGDRVVIGAALEPDIPFAAAHELIRQGKRGLGLIAPISDACGDMLIGAGCIAEIRAAWVGNMLGGVGYNYRRAFEFEIPGPITIFDYSNLSLGLALMAGAHGIPYVPVRSLLGSDIGRTNPDFQIAQNPFSDAPDPAVLVPALIPDVAIICVQRADTRGGNHHWGSRGIAEEAALAARRVILLADEIVSTDVIASDPSRVLVPPYLVSAVCHAPAGCHPAPMTGHWQRDNGFFDDYRRASRERQGFLEWLDEWVLSLPDHDAYRNKLGARLEGLRIREKVHAAPANYAVE